MVDDLTPEQRRRCMTAIRSKHSKPEIIVRRMVHKMGRRFRLHRNDLPGRPDLVLSRDRKVIFVNGCFWHAHCCQAGSRVPTSNVDYWTKKRAGNVQRDQQAISNLRSQGWNVLTIWECQLKDMVGLEEMLKKFLKQ